MFDKLTGNWKKHTITRLDPCRPNLVMSALFQYISDPWNRVSLYPPAANGYILFGVEAIISHDNGQTWDMDHIYVLREYVGHRAGETYWWASPQITSTALMPDGDLLTVFGAGEREMGFEGDPRRVGLVRWRLAP